MKYTLLLLAALLHTVCGAEISASIQGVVTTEEPCSEAVEEVLYKECVEDVAVSMGVVLSRRLELRGNRELQSQPSHCYGACCQNCSDCDCYPKGHYCWWMCSNKEDRRLRLTDEHIHTARFLVATGEIQMAANECLDRKIEEGYTCLGNPEDLTIKIFLSE
jgi:hypothetical protein